MYHKISVIKNGTNSFKITNGDDPEFVKVKIDQAIKTWKENYNYWFYMQKNKDPYISELATEMTAYFLKQHNYWLKIGSERWI